MEALPDLIAPLSFRKNNVGGETTSPPADVLENIADLLRAGPGRGLILLIHGYNNDFAAANEAYSGFFRVQRKIAELPEGRRVADDRVFVEVFWPGDADWGILSFACYMQSIDQAVRTAKLLADSLWELADIINTDKPLEVDIIGHSMGCRLATELLTALGATDRIRTRRVALMAAALPTFMIEKDGSLRPGVDAKLGGPDCRVGSLYSPNDMVLALAFPVGQTLAGGKNGIFPTALGHEMWVSSSIPANLEQQQIAGAGHSDYWGWKLDTEGIAKVANTRLAKLFGFDHAPRRQVVERSTPIREEPQVREPGAPLGVAA